jgi:hypothetical protein
MRQRVFLEIVFGGMSEWASDHDWYTAEDILDDELKRAGIGLVTGGGYGCNMDVEVFDLEQGLALIRTVLRRLRVARSTFINCYEPNRVKYPVYDEGERR